VSDPKRGVSRRGLFGVFGKGLRDLRDGLDDVHRAHSGHAHSREAGPPPPSIPLPPDPPPSRGDFERVIRPPGDLVPAEPSGAGSWSVDLGERRLEIGAHVLVSGGELSEPVILVRVHAHHWAACSCECPADGSDILWAHDEDRLRCPGCASEWRLDGESLGGPADCPLARFIVDAYEDDEGGVEVRLHQA
jgi:hypothetical protein